MASGRAVASRAVRENADAGRGREWDARRLRSQREVIRDVMLAGQSQGALTMPNETPKAFSAPDEGWFTLRELHRLTRYGEASISAQLRHLRKACNGGFALAKRFRADGFWEYRLSRG